MILTNIRAWDSKPRTMLRFIKPGDIFVFRLDESGFGFGRILVKVDLGHVAEIFDSRLSSPVITPELVGRGRRLGSPIILDTYSLFDKRLEGDWQIIAHQSDFQMSSADNVSFVYGHHNSWKKVDVLGNESAVTNDEAGVLPKYSPTRDASVRTMLGGSHKSGTVA